MALLQPLAQSPSLASLSPVPQQQFWGHIVLPPLGQEAEDPYLLQELMLRPYWLQQLPPQGRAPRQQPYTRSWHQISLKHRGLIRSWH